MATAIPGVEDRARHGIALILMAWFAFALVDTGAKWAAILAYPAAQIAFFRYIGHFVISTGLVLRDADNLRVPPYFGLVIVRALVLVAATVSNFWILRELPLTITSAIMFSTPVIVCFLSVTILRERVGLWRWCAILLGFLGVLIVIRPFGAAFHPMMLMAVMNAVFLAIYSLLTRRLAGRVSTDVMQFWMGLTGTVILLPPALWLWQPPTSATEWVVLISLGVFAWAGHQWLTTAHRFATANTLMPFTYSFLLYLTILSFLIFGHMPSIWTLIGAGVIMMSGLIIWHREGQK
ncbi:MAG: DMT family transporter [Pseudomonadota bacterium]